MTRVIMAAIPQLGHLVPLLPIGRGLVERGYDVTFITGPALRTRVEEAGAQFRPLSGFTDFDGAKMRERFPYLTQSPPGIQRMTGSVREIFIPQIPEQHAAVQEALAEGNAASTVVLHDVFFHGLWPVLLGAPGLRPAGVVGLGVTVLGLSSEETAPFGLGFAPDSSPEGIARNRALNDQVQLAFAPVQSHLDACLARLGATRAAPYYWDAHSLLPDVTFQLSTPGFEYPRSALPPHVEFIGRRLDVQDEAELPSWWPDVLAAERVVFITQGSLSNHDFGALIGPETRASPPTCRTTRCCRTPTSSSPTEGSAAYRRRCCSACRWSSRANPKTSSKWPPMSSGRAPG
jgi:UDP:flavonoid glycosyltransferase YjiC (YdhE family)